MFPPRPRPRSARVDGLNDHRHVDSADRHRGDPEVCRPRLHHGVNVQTAGVVPLIVGLVLSILYAFYWTRRETVVYDERTHCPACPAGRVLGLLWAAPRGARGRGRGWAWVGRRSGTALAGRGWGFGLWLWPRAVRNVARVGFVGNRLVDRVPPRSICRHGSSAGAMLVANEPAGGRDRGGSPSPVSRCSHAVFVSGRGRAPGAGESGRLSLRARAPDQTHVSPAQRGLYAERCASAHGTRVSTSPCARPHPHRARSPRVRTRTSDHRAHDGHRFGA
jgi:hypothetical protein